jgi:hypothetical protein
LRKGLVCTDPADKTAREHVDGWTERIMRRLNTCQYQNIIKAKIPHLKYSKGAFKELPVH